MISENIDRMLSEVAAELGYRVPADHRLEVPRDRSHGDFSSNLAMLLARDARRPPRQLAAEIAARLGERPDLEATVEVAGPGFLNFRVAPAAYARALAELLASPDTELGRTTAKTPQRVQVEYVSANPTGPLNVVSARAAAYGSTLARLLRACGHTVEEEFYVNDAGRQVEMLGASLRARRAEDAGRAVTFPEDGYHGDYVRDLARSVPAAQAQAWDALEARDRDRAYGAFAVERMVAAQQRDLQRFGVVYDRWFHESELYAEGEIERVRAALEARGTLYEKDGAWYFRSTDWGDDKDRVVIRSDGTPTYFLADAAYHHNKFRRGFEHVIDVWGPDHHGHIARMQAATRALGHPEGWLEVVIVQWVKLVEDGASVKMSKRAGQLVTLGELLDEVGADVAKYFFLMRQQNAHLDFDLALAKRQSDENPVYYVKYAHARICSVVRKAAAQGWQVAVGPDGGAAAGEERLRPAHFERLQSDEERHLMHLVLGYPELVARAAAAREPHRLTGYCEDLARAFHKFYHEHRILQDDRELGLARLGLCQATRRVLAAALGMMAIEAPESM